LSCHRLKWMSLSSPPAQAPDERVYRSCQTRRSFEQRVSKALLSEIIGNNIQQARKCTTIKFVVIFLKQILPVAEVLAAAFHSASSAGQRALEVPSCWAFFKANNQICVHNISAFE
jgi:hypothetical protein